MCFVLVDGFWEAEGRALILGRNDVPRAALAPLCGELRELVDARVPEVAAAANAAPPASEEMRRIFREDAIRTFATERFRDAQVDALNAVYAYTQDYHQGLGFTVAFLSLFLSREDVVRVCCFLHDTSCQGYYKLENKQYLRDSRVFASLLEHEDKALAQQLNSKTVAGQYLSKWFIGLGLHCFPFTTIIDYLKMLIEDPTATTHYKLALAVMKELRQPLMEAKSTAEIINLLKFDEATIAAKVEAPLKVDGGKADGDREAVDDDEETPSSAPAKATDVDQPATIYERIMTTARTDIDIDAELVRTTSERVDKELAEEEARRAAYLARLDSEDEIVFSDEE